MAVAVVMMISERGVALCDRGEKDSKQSVAYLLMNDAVVDGFGRPAINFYVSRGR